MENDLSLPTMIGKDEYEKIELSFPFARTDMKAFETKVRKAEKECGSEGFVSLYALQNQFTSQAWNSINDHESRVNRLLKNGFFRIPDSEFRED